MHLYINFLPLIPGKAADQISAIMSQVSRYISANAPKLLKQQVDEIELRFVIGEGAEVGLPPPVSHCLAPGVWQYSSVDD